MTLDLKITGPALEGLLSLVEDLNDRRDLMRDIGFLVKQSTKVRFSTEKNPRGVAWEPSLRAIRENNKTLTDSGDLRKSIQFYFDNNEVNIGTNISYASFHQQGIRRPRKGRRAPTRSGQRKHFPRRAFLGLNKIDLRKIEETVLSYLEID